MILKSYNVDWRNHRYHGNVKSNTRVGCDMKTLKTIIIIAVLATFALSVSAGEKISLSDLANKFERKILWNIKNHSK